MLTNLRCWLADHLDPSRPAPALVAPAEPSASGCDATTCRCDCASQDLVITSRIGGISEAGNITLLTAVHVQPATVMTAWDAVQALRYAEHIITGEAEDDE